MAADVEDQTVRSHTVGRGQVGRQTRLGLGRQLGVGRGQVDEVGGVAERSHHGRMLGLGCPIARQDLVAVLGRLPHAGALGEDLDGISTDVRPVLQGRDQALSCSYMRSDQHGRTVAVALAGRCGANDEGGEPHIVGVPDPVIVAV